MFSTSNKYKNLLCSSLNGLFYFYFLYHFLLVADINRISIAVAICSRIFCFPFFELAALKKDKHFGNFQLLFDFFLVHFLHIFSLFRINYSSICKVCHLPSSFCKLRFSLIFFYIFVLFLVSFFSFFVCRFVTPASAIDCFASSHSHFLFLFSGIFLLFIFHIAHEPQFYHENGKLDGNEEIEMVKRGDGERTEQNRTEMNWFLFVCQCAFETTKNSHTDPDHMTRRNGIFFDFFFLQSSPVCIPYVPYESSIPFRLFACCSFFFCCSNLFICLPRIF